MSQEAPPKEEAAPRPSGEGEAVAGEVVSHHPGPDVSTDGLSPAETIQNYPNLYARQTAFNTYQVIHLARDGNRVYEVVISEPSCTCPDFSFNRDLPHVCKHVSAALMAAPQTIPAEQLGTLMLSGQLNRLRADADRIERLATGLEADAAAAEARPAGAGAPSNPGPAARQASAEDAADRLQDAYDEVTEDMQVQASEGYVWVQTGQDTPDSLPGPGNVSVFDALLKEPEQVEYIHEEHGDVDLKPGKWWRNRIAPEDVDTYISEVLE